MEIQRIDYTMKEKIIYIINSTISSLLIITGNVTMFIVTLIILVFIDLFYCFSIKRNDFNLKLISNKLLSTFSNFIVFSLLILVSGIIDNIILSNSLFGIDYFLIKLVSLLCFSVVLRSIEKTHIISGGKRFKHYLNSLINLSKTIKNIFKDEENTK